MNEVEESFDVYEQTQNQFTKRLKELRNEKGITQEELAKTFKVNRMTIVQWEKGTSQPSYLVLKKLADFFSVDVKYFYGGDDDIKELEALTRELNLDFEQTKERLQALQDYYTKSIEMLDDERKRILSKVDSDESFSLQTYRSLYRMFNENILKIELFSQFVHDLHMLEVEL